MTKKVLFVATVLKKHIDHFHIPYIKYYRDQGYDVDVAAYNDYDGEEIRYSDCYKFLNVNFSRNPFSISNWRAYKKMRKILEDGDYEIVHCHTPVASVVTRLAAIKARKKGTRVIYTAHGFQFLKGGPKINWIFLPIEIFAGFFTDDLITINEEDYKRAQKWIPARNIYLMNGVGVSLDKFSFEPKMSDKKEPLIISCVAELTPNKNHRLLIELAHLMKTKKEKFEMWFIGEGDYKQNLILYAEELNVLDHIVFLGYRRDVPQLLHQTDIVISTSFREGLPVNILEAYASGVPVITTDTRGSRDLVNKIDRNLVSEFEPSALYERVKNLKNSKYKEDIINRQRKLISNYEVEYLLKEYQKILEQGRG